MKKVLIISGNNHLVTSGADFYNARLIKILQSQNYHVDEYSFEYNMSEQDRIYQDEIKIISPSEKFNDCSKSKLKWWITNLYNVSFRSRRQLDKLIDEYDLVIDSSLMLVRSKKLFNHPNYLYVQHQSSDFFQMKRYGFLTPLAIFLIWLTGFKNCFKLANNIVFFDENNRNFVQKKFKSKNSKKYFCIYNANISKETIIENKKLKDQIYADNSFKRNIFYIGRVTKEQKRMNDVDKMMKLSKNKLDIFGFGTYVKKIIKNKNIIYHGKIDQKEVIETNLYSKVHILMSNYEGFSGALVESICSSTPIIIRDSWISAKFLADNNKNGFLWEKNLSIKEYQTKFDEINNLPIENLKELSDNCFRFALENLTYEKFEENWIKVLKEMIG